MAHTPGEWRVDDKDQGRITIISDDSIEPPWNVCELCYGLSGGVKETKANANLIAAAPKMYEALKQSLHDIETTGYTQQTINTIRTAIAAAEGTEEGKENG